MPQHRQRRGLHVLGQHVVPPVQKRPHPGALGQGQRCPRRRPGLQQRAELQPRRRRVPRRQHQVHQVAPHRVAQRHAVDQRPGPGDHLRPHHPVHRKARRQPRHAVQDRQLVRPPRVVHQQFHQKPVQLRLGQGVRAFLFDRVLRRHHDERLGQREGLAADGHLPLLHRLQQRRLHLRRGAVDLVGQHQVAEQRPLVRHKLLRLRPVHLRPRQVRRQQVGRELQPLKVHRHRPGQRADRRGLRQPRRTFHQQVPAGQHADHHRLDQRTLPHHHLPHLVDHAAERGAGGLDRSGVGGHGGRRCVVHDRGVPGSCETVSWASLRRPPMAGSRLRLFYRQDAKTPRPPRKAKPLLTTGFDRAFRPRRVRRPRLIPDGSRTAKTGEHRNCLPCRS